MALLTPLEVKSRLAALPGWTRRGKVIAREFEFADFAGSVRFVVAVGRVADRLDHHPDVDIRWNRVRMALSTHSAGGLTALDFDLAARIDAVAARSGAVVQPARRK